MPEQPKPELIAKFVHEKQGKIKDTYSEYEPTWIFGNIYPNRMSLIQTFGDVPKKIQITITVVEK